MSLQKRYSHQIDEIRHTFEIVAQGFDHDKPVDNVLKGIFRSNKKYGSRDRRYISNSIFGYYRWLGWLKQLKIEEPNLHLLLGYLLDENKVDDFVEFWAKDCGLAPSIFSKLVSKQGLGLQQKSEIMSGLVPNTDISLLNPKQFPENWNINTIECFQQRPHLWIRFVENVSQSFLAFLSDRNIEYRLSETNSLSLEIMSPVNLNESTDFRQGKLEIQDVTSQLVGIICQPAAGETWWDVCAGSGGKSLHLASLMKGKGTVYSTEVSSHYFKELLKRSNRNYLYKNIEPLKWDGITRPNFDRKIDGVLIDAPCSSSGTWRRSPWLRWKTTSELILHYSNLQYEILSRVAAWVSKGTPVVYATCSIFPEENEKVIERFLKMFDDFTVENIEILDSENASGMGIYLLPPRVNGNGMFVSRLIRQ